MTLLENQESQENRLRKFYLEFKNFSILFQFFIFLFSSQNFRKKKFRHLHSHELLNNLKNLKISEKGIQILIIKANIFKFQIKL